MMALAARWRMCVLGMKLMIGGGMRVVRLCCLLAVGVRGRWCNDVLWPATSLAACSVARSSHNTHDWCLCRRACE